MIRTKKDLEYYISRDETVNGGGENKIIRWLYPSPIKNFLFLLRHVEYYTNTPSFLHKVVLLYYKWRLRRQSMKLGYTIPPNVFGAGLSLPHYGTIVVNPRAKVGENCRLHVGVNIGASAGRKEAPQLGDNVYIGPGAILFGNIVIANNVTIGANATVNKSFEVERSTIAGTPAKVVKADSPNWLEFNEVERGRR